jgi:hypothetical protein
VSVGPFHNGFPAQPVCSILRQIRRVLLPLLLLICADAAPAQGTGGLRGFVADSAKGEAIPFATVFLRGTALGTVTNVRGYYYLPAIPAGQHELIISFVGYRSTRIPVVVQEQFITQVNAALAPADIEIGEVVVVREQTREPDRQVGLQALSPRDIALTPRGVEADVLRIIQQSAGVSSTGDATTRYYVRGGGSDQNLILLNGATLYNPYHALGVFSVIDPEMISSAEFYRGGFGPQYGGRLSSILSVVTRKGNRNRISAVAEASLIAGKAAVEGPLPHGSFLLTGRKSYTSAVLGRYLGGRRYPFDFHDASFSLTHSNPVIDPNGRLTLHGFTSGDRVAYQDPLKEDYDTRNTILGLQWNKVWSTPLYSTVTLAYSGSFAVVQPNLSGARARENRVTDLSMAADFGYVYDSRDELGFGLQLKSLQTDLRAVNVYDVPASYAARGWDADAYVDYRFNRWESLLMNLGLRARFIAMAEKWPMFFEPRLGVGYRVGPLLTLKASAGWYSQQVVTLVEESELISVFEPWVIVPPYLAPPQAASYGFGVVSHLTESLRLEAEIYYKSMLNLVETNPAKYTASARDYTQFKGEAYGLEITVAQQARPFSIQASYTLSHAVKLAGNERRPTRYDVRHSALLVTAMEFPGGWHVSLSWALRTGLPFAPIAGFYERLDYQPGQGSVTENPYVPVVFWGPRHSARLPLYHRLDLSLGRKFGVGPVTAAIEGSVINLYDRKNIYYFDRDTGEAVTMMRFSPFISLRVEL